MPSSTSAKVTPDPQYTWAIRYESLNATDANPADPNSWTPYIHVIESMLEAADLYRQWKTVYKNNPNIRNIQVVRAPKVAWEVVTNLV